MYFTLISEEEADEEIKQAYQRLKGLFKVGSLPAFFYFLGNFPDYFLSLASQIERNFSHPRFRWLVNETKSFLANIFKEAEICRINDVPLRTSLAFYKEDLNRLIDLNVGLLLLVLAQREALKGRAFGLKSLPQDSERARESFNENQLAKADLLWKEAGEGKGEFLSKKEESIEKYDQSLILPFDEVLARLSLKLEGFLAHERNFLLRVSLERLLVELIGMLPEKLQIDYKYLAGKAKEDPRYLELIYFLSDALPTLLTHKVMLLFAIERLAKQSQS